MGDGKIPIQENISMVDQSKNGAYDEVWKKLRCAVAKGHLFDG